MQGTLQNTHAFPYGTNQGQRIMNCSNIKELLKFIYYPFKPIRHTVRRRLHQLGYVITKEEIKRRRVYKYHFPEGHSLNATGKLIFTICQKYKDIHYAVQIYRCYEGKLVWLYTVDPPTDKIGDTVKLKGTIVHKSSNGKPITLLTRKKENSE